MQQFLWYFEAGGILMWPLLGCSLLALGVVIERLIRARRGAVIDPVAIEDIQKLLEAGEVAHALEKHKSGPTALVRVICRALADDPRPDEFEKTLLHAAQRELLLLTNNLGLLAVIAKVAPLLGLLGTVFGMIAGFEALEKAGAGKAQLAVAVRVALITTAAGLSIAIPTVIALAFFRARVRRCQAECEEILDAVARSWRDGLGARKKKEPEPLEAPIEKDDDRFELPSILSGRG